MNQSAWLALALVACGAAPPPTSTPTPPPTPISNAPAADPAPAEPAEPSDSDPSSSFAPLVVGAADPNQPKGVEQKDLIKRDIVAARPQISNCYEQALLNDASLTGVTRASFMIGADGAVVVASASGFVPVVDDCVADVIRSLRFSTEIGSVSANYPFKFQRE